MAVSTRQAVYVFETSFVVRDDPGPRDPSYGDVMDLHGYSAAVARAAIRSGLKKLLRRFLVAGEAWCRDKHLPCSCEVAVPHALNGSIVAADGSLVRFL